MHSLFFELQMLAPVVNSFVETISINYLFQENLTCSVFLYFYNEKKKIVAFLILVYTLKYHSYLSHIINNFWFLYLFNMLTK